MVRSIVFAAVFYVVTAAFVILGSPLLLGPRSWAMAGLWAHAVVSLWLLERIVGTRLEVRGREKLPPAPYLVAAKHQSAWDTFGLIPIFRDPALVLKAELLMIPFYGWFCRKFEHIAVRRAAGPRALRQMARDARHRADQGREILIFPEGTRRAPGAEPDYKPGVLMLYDHLRLPCVPLALNSGVYWPRRKLMRYPGTIVVEMLDAIPPGLSRPEFKSRLERELEAACARLVAEAQQDGKGAPMMAGT
jgi:1-acyl-sn-glycerol-3-phosphate acyltransferase